MRVFPLYETELEILSFLNTVTVVAFAVGSGFLGSAVSIWVERGPLTQTSPILTSYVAYGALIIAVVAYGLGALAWNNKRSRLDTIKRSIRDHRLLTGVICGSTVSGTEHSGAARSAPGRRSSQ